MLTKEQKAIVFENLKNLAAVYETDKTKEVLNFYVEILSEFSFQEVSESIAWAVRNLKWFPKPVELIDQIKPKANSSDAVILSGEIIDAIRKFGYMQSNLAREHLGEIAWRAVRMAGGWQIICDTPEAQLSQLRSQLREFCLTSLNRPDLENRRIKIEMYQSESNPKDNLKKLFNGNNREN